MSREIEELRAMAKRERDQVRELGAAWKSSAVDGWLSVARRHRGKAIAAALGAGYLGVRLLGARGARPTSKKRGLARASLGAAAALLVKALPAIAMQATAELRRDRTKAPEQEPTTVPTGPSPFGSTGPHPTPRRLSQSTDRVSTP